MSLTNNFIYFIFITQYTEFINGGCMDKPGFEYLIGREKWCKIFTPINPMFMLATAVLQ